MTLRATWNTCLGLALAAFVASAMACKKDKTEPGEGPATTEPGDTPPASDTPPVEPEEAKAGHTAAAEVKAASGSKVSGTVTFAEQDGSVEVSIDLQGLPPGEHGFHVHETGDCSAPDATSAGGHFNPGELPHGSPNAPRDRHHAGDFGNLTAAEDGTVKTSMKVDFITVAEGERSVVGKAVVVHEKPDDLKSQPTGDAGGRIGCGVVEKK
jgi:Cu-Zn family superoxide dismutase